MRGLDYITALRRKGFKPAHITFSESPYDAELTPLWPQYEPGDTPETHDLRIVVGVFVAVMGSDAQLVKRWCLAAMKAGASTVMGATWDRDPLRGVWTEYRLYGIDQ